MLIAAPAAAPPRQATGSARPFAAEIAALSEPGGYFDTDNLISNERSYLHAVSDLAAAGLSGGAYVGVGPDQNFSYIAQARPAVAFILDIRRDNLLLHLLFKSLFAIANTRAEYLSLVFGRPPPDAAWNQTDRSIEDLVRFIDSARPLSGAALDALRSRVAEQLAATGVPLSDDDCATIGRFHQRFIAAGLSLQFNSTGRAPQAGYPTYRDLVLEVDREGRHRNFLASDASFQVVKRLQDRDLVIPVVGNLAGPTALANIGQAIARRGLRLSVFYASNVEFYLFRDGSFSRFVRNLGRAPRSDRALIIRSVFGGQAATLPGYNSATLTQPVGDLVNGFAKGRFRSYWEIVRTAAPTVRPAGSTPRTTRRTAGGVSALRSR
jgi:hypothetical protein